MKAPTHSLPSYDEPTPETGGRISREEEAERAMQGSEFTAGTRTSLIFLFLLTIVSVGAVQFLRGPRPKVNPWMFWDAGEIKSFEKQLESDSVISQWLLPPTQSLLTEKLGAGNEQVYLGRDGWLFYRPDVDYVTGPPFLAPAQLQHRAHSARIQPDPVKAIVQFRDQLAARGIALVVMPVPVKPSIEGEMLNARVSLGQQLQNASFADFKARLANDGVRVFDAASLLAKRKVTNSERPLYLKTDTHWRPETMEFVAGELARSLALLPSNAGGAQVFARQIHSLGDIARMLKLPQTESLFPPEEVTIREVMVGNGMWRSSPEADVLLLGDSFSNIFSLETLGWGESAGFAEQLSHSLGRPLDCILRNSDGAFATREILSRELARGHDRLAGKRMVVWEFAARELAFGDWKMIDLKLGQALTPHFYSPPPGEAVKITGTVAAVSAVPRPGTVPYREHIMALQLDDVQVAGTAKKTSTQAIVYLYSMRDNSWTPAGRLRPGDHAAMTVRAWADVASRYEQINRSDLDDPALQLEEPVWGDLNP